MIVKLNINEHWISDGWDNEKDAPIKRIQTLDEYLEYQCQVCFEKIADFEIHFETSPQEEFISVCRDCGKAIILSLMDNEEFYDNMRIYKY